MDSPQEPADLWIDLPAFRGGCQCGATRYSLRAGRALATICHCRMCQRASGGPFGAFLKVDADRLSWHGRPAVYASSNIAERGFCPQCGTPLFYRALGTSMIEVTAGSLPAGLPFNPVRQWGLEGRHPWLAVLTMPGAATSETDITSHQAEERG